jgi:hypothetical protein
MDIRSALAELVLIEKAVAITDPVDLAVKHVYPFMTDPKTARPDLPCFTNSWTLTGYQRRGGFGREDQYAVRTHLYAAEAMSNGEVGADIATAMFVEFIRLLDRNPGLSGTCSEAVPRGGDPTLVLIAERWIGIELYLDLAMKSPKSFGGG